MDVVSRRKATVWMRLMLQWLQGLTLPAQKMSLSAKYCVARSPMASRDSTTLAPDCTIFSSLL